MSMSISKLTDEGAAKIAEKTYKRNAHSVILENGNEEVIYNVIEIIEDKSTGLHGYVLKNEKTKEIVISFEGTQKSMGLTQSIGDLNEDISGVVFGLSTYVEKENKPTPYRGSPGQDALFATGQAKIENGKVVKINTNQFTEADKVVSKYIDKHGPENITFVGHSLGGALSEFFAVKYNSNAVTFAAPDIYNLLTKEQKKKVKNGDFKENIISYAYPDDLVSWFGNKSIGSTYFLAHPSDAGFLKTFENHGVKNYIGKDMFDKNGYFLANLLVDETLLGSPEKSPLAMKNSGLSNFNIVIKAYIMSSFVKGVEKNRTRIENTERSLLQFWDVYSEEMIVLKRKYNRMVGTGQYDMLSTGDVQEAFSSFGKEENSVPLVFNMYMYEELLQKTKLLLVDTEEIAFQKNQMNEDFKKADTMVAERLKY